jgi:hypothetical protein
MLWTPNFWDCVVVDDGAERWKIVVVEERVRRRGGVEENVQRAQGGLWWRLARVREGDVRVSVIIMKQGHTPDTTLTLTR